MNKKYTIEVPIYSTPVERLIKLNKLEDINIVMYGGAPDSPLNGGRFNHCLDGLFIWDRLLFGLNKRQLAGAKKRFYKTVAKANQNGIPFFLAYTNMFVSQEELNEENLYPVKWLVESSEKCGVKNGVILYNKLLEDFLRRKYQNKLVYVSSCTKYVSPNKLLTPKETLPMYLEDSGKYDFIVLTPQDSRRPGLIKDVLRQSKSKIVAICNSYCANNCNSYHHYKYTSFINKKSLLKLNTIYALFSTLNFAFRRIAKCSAVIQPFHKVNVRKIASMQLEAGIVNFKLGRGFGAELLNQLVSLVLKFNK